MAAKLLSIPKVQKIRTDLMIEYRNKFDTLCELLDGTFWRPYSGKRSFAEQDALWQQGRLIKNLPIVTDSKGGESPHNWGCATDWFYPKSGQDAWEDAPWQEFANAVRKAGLRWGGDFKDKPHCELAIDCSWKKVFEIYLVNKNELESQEFIKKHLI